MSHSTDTPSRKAPAGWSLGLNGAHRVEQAIDRVENGLAMQAATRLKEKLALSNDELASLLHISARTLARRRQQGRLTPDESDRLYRMARLYERAVEVMGAEEEARHWLRHPQLGLGGSIPLTYARTEPGTREVETLLGRIDYGVLA